MVLGVLAETREQAEVAAKAVKITYEEKAPLVTIQVTKAYINMVTTGHLSVIPLLAS